MNEKRSITVRKTNNKTARQIRQGFHRSSPRASFILAVAATNFFLSHREINELSVLSVLLSCISLFLPFILPFTYCFIERNLHARQQQKVSCLAVLSVFKQ